MHQIVYKHLKIKIKNDPEKLLQRMRNSYWKSLTVYWTEIMGKNDKHFFLKLLRVISSWNLYQ